MIRGHAIGYSARNGLITARPYRYKGRTGWDPAATASRKHQADIATPCPQCGAASGRNCQTSGGRVYQDYEPSHSARRRAS